MHLPLATDRVLSSTQGCWDSDLPKIRSAHILLQKVQNSLGRVDGRPATDAHDDVCAGLLEELDTVSNARDRGVLADFVERRGVRAAFFEDVLDGLHNIRLHLSGE